MIGNACADELVMCIGFDKVTDVCRGGCVGGMFAKEDLDAERRMAHALGVLKGVPASQLFKAAHIV